MGCDDENVREGEREETNDRPWIAQVTCQLKRGEPKVYWLNDAICGEMEGACRRLDAVSG